MSAQPNLPIEVEQGKKPQSEALQVVKPTAMDLLSVALHNNAAIDVIERLAALQLEGRKLDAEVDFQDHLNACQAEVQLVIFDSDKAGPGGKKWATYKAMDKAIRPIYTQHGFSLSFGTEEYTVQDQILVTCLVSRGLHTRTYRMPMDVSGQGAKGGAALSKPHAFLAGMEYGRRCLLKMIFNIVTGEEADLETGATNGEIAEQIGFIKKGETPDEVRSIFRDYYVHAEEAGDRKAMHILLDAKDERIKELKNASR